MDHSIPHHPKIGQRYIHSHMNLHVPVPVTASYRPPPPHFRRQYSVTSSTIETKTLKRSNSNKRKQESFSYEEQRHYDDSAMFKRRMTSSSHDTADEDRTVYDGDETRDAAPSSPLLSSSHGDGHREEHERLVHRQVKRVGSSELASAMALASLAYGNSETKRDGRIIPSRQSSFSDSRSITTSATPRPPSKVSHPHRQGLFMRSLSETSSYGSSGHSGRNHLLRHDMNRPLHGYNSPYDSYYDERQGPPMTISNPDPGIVASNTNTRSLESNKKQWVCDYCNKESFPTYEEACRHEEQCSFNPSAPNHSKMSIHDRASLGNGSSSSRKNCHHGTNVSVSASRSSKQIHGHQGKRYFEGVIPLSVPVTDSDWLSETNCFIRKECVEAFSAKEGDIMVSSKRGRISLQQVGIRCRFCSKEEPKDRGSGAVSFPVSVSGIYESVKRWKSVHLAECKCIPEEVKEKIKSMEKSSCVPTTRQYWIDSAKALGIEDTIDGLRFISDPYKVDQSDAHESMIKTRFAPSWAKKSKSQNGDDEKDNYIVFPADKSTITPFVYCLMRQVQPCVFTEADRFLSRSKSKVGFAGFECRHCNGHAGLGRYFPSTPKALSTNSTSQNIYSHIQKCRKCPQEVKDELKNIKREKPTWLRRTCGWRQAFFALLWERLHG